MTTLIESPVPAPAPDHPGLLGAPRPDLATHRAVHGPLPVVDPARFLAEVEHSGLTGRGGAGFPAAVKMHAVAALSGGRAVVVANAAEGEPASRKDRQLLASAPHLVLDGLQLAGSIVGAARLIIYVRPELAGAVQHALAERSRTEARVTVRIAADGFVAGQETAVVSALNGGPALPQYAPVRVTQRGVGGRPTLVQNAETLAHLALIARHGGDWFASTGAPGSAGTFLATVHAAQGSSAPSVWELPYGTTLRSLLDVAGPTPAEDLQAVLIGGYYGTWVRMPHALDAPLSTAGLRPFGATVGAGLIMPISWRTCGLDTTARIVRYLAGESAKQCGPCEFGLPHLATLMGRLANGSASAADLSAIRATAGLVTGRGACHHPDGTAGLVASALAAFEQDITVHGHGRCLARTGNEGGWL